MTTAAQKVGKWLLGILQGAAGGAFGAITAAILFLYVFISLLTNRDKVLLLIRQLNPLGEEVTDLYMSKMGAMVKGTVMGQFIIAACQGVAGAASIYIAGFHQGFFLFAVLLSALSVIPLGSGIVTIPFGIGMILFGNVFGGIFVIVFHIIVVTNIDNFLRPILVPREARLDSALMLLAVFAGIAMFGAWGIVIGPVLMIVIVTTISVYLAVYKGVPMDSPEEDEKPKRRRLSAGATVAGRRPSRPRSPPSQPLVEELDDALARFVGRMAVDSRGPRSVSTECANLPKPYSLPFFESISMTSNASPRRAFSVLKRSPGDSRVLAEPQAHGAQPSSAARCSTSFNSLRTGRGRGALRPSAATATKAGSTPGPTRCRPPRPPVRSRR